MTRDRGRRVLLAVLVMLALAAPAAGVVSAQEATETATGTEAEEDSKIVAQVDSKVRVTDYWYNATAESFSVRFENTGDVGSEITVTEAIGRGQGSRSFGIERIQLYPGESAVVTVSARRVEGSAGVMITTEESVSNGEGTYLEEESGMDLFGSATWADVRAGVLFAVAVMVALIVIGAWYLVSQRHEDVQEVDIS